MFTLQWVWTHRVDLNGLKFLRLAPIRWNESSWMHIVGTNGVNLDDDDLLIVCFGYVGKLPGPLCHFLPSHQFQIANTTLPACQNNFMIWTARMWFRLHLNLKCLNAAHYIKFHCPKLYWILNALLVNLGPPTIEFFFPGCLIQERAQFLDFSFG